MEKPAGSKCDKNQVASGDHLGRQGEASRTLALRVTRSLLAQASKATLLGLPGATSGS